MSTVAAFPSHVQPHEEVDAKRLIDEMFVKLTGKPFEAKVCGYLICLKIYIRPEELKKVVDVNGVEQTIWRPNMTATNDKYQSVTALVVGVGPDAYKGTNPDGSPKYAEPWCRVGDWVTVPRYEAHLVSYRGVTMGMLPDDRIMMVISDPTDVEPIHQSDMT